MSAMLPGEVAKWADVIKTARVTVDYAARTVIPP
jgi:hypothetical protein